VSTTDPFLAGDRVRKVDSPNSFPPPGLLVVMDFDGTMTVSDCLDAVFARRTEGWHDVLQRVARLEIGKVAGLQEQMAKLHLSVAQAVAEFAVEAQLRAGLAQFLRWVGAEGGRAAVVSLGFREGISAVWERDDLPPVKVFASELRAGRAAPADRITRPRETPGLQIVVNEGFGDCELCGPGACKAALVDKLRRPGDLVVAFGDGTADLCMARRAHLTFARGRLAELCAAEALPWRPLVDFVAAQAALSAWLDECRAS
jgi:2-hydroxy-3-keto-5-methylthiopentenyl-1-phosphate phosphatase